MITLLNKFEPQTILDLTSEKMRKEPSDTRDDDRLIASIEQDPIVQSLPRRATFIPLRHADAQHELVEFFELTGDDRKNFELLCKRMQAIFHVEHLSALIHLEEIYSPLDPDSEVIELDALDEGERDELTNRLFDRVAGLLYSAHYKRLTRHELEAAIEVGSQWGVKLDVDFDLYERLEIFARGYRVITVDRRRWQNFYRKESIELPEFQRLIMAFRFKPQKNIADSIDSSRVYLKTFKNIPETDLEILLPGTKIRLSMLDRGKILVPSITGAAIMIYKLARGLLLLTVAFTMSAILAWVLFIGAAIGYVAKSVISYFNTRNKYQFGLTRSLYLKNLDNNSGVIYRILNEAEEQELLEAILGYTVLWQSQSPGMTATELDGAVEKFLLEVTKVDIDFEVHDALGKMARLGLAAVDRDGLWRATPIKEAPELLGRRWERLFQARSSRAARGTATGEDLFTS